MTIKATFLSLLVFAVFSACTPESSTDTAESDKVLLENLLMEFLAGASTNDAEMHDRFWADELIYTGSAGNRTTKEEIMAGLADSNTSGEGDIPEYGAEDVQIDVYDGTAVVAFRLTAETDTEKMEYYNTGTFLKRSGEWRAVAWQATRIPD